MNKIEELIGYGREHQCSDIHLTYGVEPVMRCSGKLVRLKGYGIMDDENLSKCADVVLRIAGTRQADLANGLKDIEICYQMKDGSRSRINMYREQGHTAIAIHLLKEHAPTLEELGVKESIAPVLTLHQGLILAAGPVGSGKSTLLASCIHELNRNQEKYIITAENPVEYGFINDKSIINQREVGLDVESYEQAIYSAIREDSDVIFVSEIKDKETAAAVLCAVETGHLVFSSVHTADVESTIQYLVHLFPQNSQPRIEMQIKDSLQAVVEHSFDEKTKEIQRCVQYIGINDSAADLK